MVTAPRLVAGTRGRPPGRATARVPARREPPTHPAALARLTDGRAVSVQTLLSLQSEAGNRAVARALTQAVHGARRQAARKPTAAFPPLTIQREMKFELQIAEHKNRVFRNDGVTATELPRKFGPEDFLVKGGSGVRLESETGGVVEFETTWEKKWPKLQKQLAEAFRMTQDIDASPAAPSGRKKFPFPVPHLRTGTRAERRKGRWARRKGFEGRNEKILTPGEQLEVDVKDPVWNAGIQVSETFELGQYESFLREHEFPDYREPVVADADDILKRVNTGGIPVKDLANLRNFLMIIVNYIMRGQGGSKSEAAGAFEDVKDKPSKQALILMSRTNFASMYRSLLSSKERRLFRRIVRRKVILTEMGLDRRTPFFIKGFGRGHRGPTVHEWLKGIPEGKDALSVQDNPRLSAAMGRFNVETKKKKKDTGLVRFEARNRPGGAAFADAKDWVAHGFFAFLSARMRRGRKTGKGETGLEVT